MGCWPLALVLVLALWGKYGMRLGWDGVKQPHKGGKKVWDVGWNQLTYFLHSSKLPQLTFYGPVGPLLLLTPFFEPQK